MQSFVLLATSLALVGSVIGLCVLLFAHRGLKRYSAARFSRRLARHAALTTRLSVAEDLEFDSLVADLRRVRDCTLQEAILDSAREGAAKEALPGLTRAYEVLQIVSRYIDRLEQAHSWEERARAAERLGRIGSVSAVPALLRVVRDVRDEDDDVRGAALRALGRIGDPAALSPLIEALGAAEASLPPRIAEIILMFGEAAVRPLIAELRNLESDTRRMWAADMLGRIADARAATPLIDSLGDVNPEVRAKAAAGLGAMRDARAVDRLLELLLSDPIPFVRTRVAHALGAIGHPRVIDHLVHGLGDAEWWVRIRAVEALEQLGAPAAGALLVALEDEDSEVRRRAGMALERTGYVQGCLETIEAEGFRADVFKVLQLIGQSGATEVLFEKLPTCSGKTQELLVRIVGDIGNPAAVLILLPLLSLSGDARLRSRLVEALGKLGCTEATPQIVGCLKDPDEWVRSAAIAALVASPPAGEADNLIRLLRDPQPPTRRAACTVLATLGDAGQFSALLEALSDPSPSVRAEAIRAAAALQVPDAADTVQAALFDFDAGVRREAAQALLVFGGPASVNDLLRAAKRDGDHHIEPLVAALCHCHSGSFEDLLTVASEPLTRGLLVVLLDSATRLTGAGRFRFVTRHVQAEDPVVRRRAVLALRAFRRVEARRAIAQALEDPDAATRETAVVVVGLMGSEELFEAVERRAVDPHGGVRRHAALTLGLASDARFHATLKMLCRDVQPDVRAAAAMALALADDPALLGDLKECCHDAELCEAARTMFVPHAQDLLISRVVVEAGKRDRLEPHLFLGGSRFALEKDMAHRARTALSTDERARAVEICGVVATGQSYTTALTILKNDPSHEVRLRALDLLLINRQDAEVARVIGSVLIDPHPAVRVRAAQALGRLDFPEALEALIHVLDTADRDLREAVTTSLLVHLKRDPDNAERLMREIPESRTRKLGLVWLFGKHRRGGALRQLLRYLADEDSEVRAAAVGALAKFPLGKVARFIARVLADPNVRVRAAGVNALGRTQGETWAEPLEQMLRDPDAFVRRRAAVALLRLGTPRTAPFVEAPACTPDDLRPVWVAGGLLHGTQTANDVLSCAGAAEFVRELLPLSEIEAVLRGPSEASQRRGALRALQVLAPERVEATAAALRFDPDPEVRAEAAVAETTPVRA